LKKCDAQKGPHPCLLCVCDERKRVQDFFAFRGAALCVSERAKSRERERKSRGALGGESRKSKKKREKKKRKKDKRNFSKKRHTTTTTTTKKTRETLRERERV
jgi:hypothetical protein